MHSIEMNGITHLPGSQRVREDAAPPLAGAFDPYPVPGNDRAARGVAIRYGPSRLFVPTGDGDHAPRQMFVECDGSWHRIVVVGDAWCPLDHDPDEIRRENLLAALTGTPVACIAVIDTLFRPDDPRADRETGPTPAVVEGGTFRPGDDAEPGDIDNRSYRAFLRASPAGRTATRGGPERRIRDRWSRRRAAASRHKDP